MKIELNKIEKAINVDNFISIEDCMFDGYAALLKNKNGEKAVLFSARVLNTGDDMYYLHMLESSGNVVFTMDLIDYEIAMNFVCANYPTLLGWADYDTFEDIKETKKITF